MFKKYKYTVTALLTYLLLMGGFFTYKTDFLNDIFDKEGKQFKFGVHSLASLSPHTVSKDTLQQTQFESLASWQQIDAAGSLKAFQRSCQLWVKQDPHHAIGNSKIPMTVQDWLPICHQALNLPANISSQQAKQFFEVNFKPFHWKNYNKGKFTGYYSPTFSGSVVKTQEFNTPLYSLPKDLISADVGQFYSQLKHKKVAGRLDGNQVKPYYSRSEIYQGAIQGKAKVVAWLRSPLDAMLLEIEGSGVIETKKGEHIFVGYAGENGRKYKSIAQLLISHKVLKASNASVSAIKHYFAQHPSELKHYVQLNPSYVFFSRYQKPNFMGAQNVSLTPNYSLAVDKRFIPLGVPLFLTTAYPVDLAGATRALSRVMIAQDTGGAIKGPIRGDIYWGIGNKAMQIASLMSHEGDYWFLLPKHFRIG